MFLSLFLKECRQILKSITFYLYLIILVFFYFSQLSDFTPITKPVEGLKSYGADYATDKQDIIEGTLGKLCYDFIYNSFTAYPMGFYKNVKLSESELAQVARILEEDTGMNSQELHNFMEKAYEEPSGDFLENPLEEPSGNPSEEAEEMDYTHHMQYWPDIKPVEGLTYEKFEEQMKEIDKIIGGGSDYVPARLYKNAERELTYEDVLKEYEDTLYKDKISNAYARLFCDYLGIMLAILPVFLAVTRAMRDRRAKADQVIYARKVSSLTVILSRYLATLVFALIPVCVLGGMVTMQCIYYGKSLNVGIDTLAFVKYILGWLMPTVMTAISIGFFFTELTDTPIAVLIQGVWWMISNFIAFGNGTLVGNFGMNLIPRWNTLGKYEKFSGQFSVLVINRIFYGVLALVLLAGTTAIYELKRKGKWNFTWKRIGNNIWKEQGTEDRKKRGMRNGNVC